VALDENPTGSGLVGAGVRTDLDDLGSIRQPLLDLCDLVENHLVEVAAGEVSTCVATLAAAHDQRFVSLSDRQFSVDGKLYETRVTENVRRPLVLDVAIAPIAAQSDWKLPRSPEKVKVHGAGRYAEVDIYLHESLAAARESMASALKAIFEVGYRWLQAHVMGELIDIEHAACSAMYTELRKSLPPPLWQHIWLYVLAERKGLYVPDPIVVQDVLTTASARRSVGSLSPLELTVDFATRMLEANNTVSMGAIAADSIFEGDFSASPYASTGFGVTEELVWQYDTFAVQPLVRGGKILVVAGYPANLQAEIQPMLEKSKNRLAHVVNDQAKSMHRRVLGLKHEGEVHERFRQQVMELGGTFTGKLLNELFGLPSVHG
jgi:hypothetical protein